MTTIRRRDAPSQTVSGVTYEGCYRGWVRTMEVGKLEVYLESEWEVVPAERWVDVDVRIVNSDPKRLLAKDVGVISILPNDYRWHYEMDCTGAYRLVVQRRVPCE